MADKELLTISEVSVATEVKAVTLRAWQRRYGLIKPQRSSKGHRLFSRQDVETIRQIVAWLSQGVSIGQVKSLLKTPTTSKPDNGYRDDQDRLLYLSCTLKLAELEHELDDLMHLYPTQVLHRQILMPWLQELEKLQRPDADLIRYSSQQTLTELLCKTLNNPYAKTPLWLVVTAGVLSSYTVLLCRHELNALGLNSHYLGPAEPDQFALHHDRFNQTGTLILLGSGLSHSRIKQLQTWTGTHYFIGAMGQAYQDQGWLEQPFYTSIQDALGK